MSQILVRQVSPPVLRRLKARARRHGRSLQAEVKGILEQAARASVEDPQAVAAKVRRMLAGRRHTDSGRLQAEDRSR